MAGLSFVSCWGGGGGAGSSSDPNVGFQALGVTVDMTSRTMGIRTRRFAMYVDDGEVQFSTFLSSCGSWHFFHMTFRKIVFHLISMITQ